MASWGRRAFMRGVGAAAATGTAFTASAAFAKENNPSGQCQLKGVTIATPQKGVNKRGAHELPTIPLKKVHDGEEGRVWVTFRGGVYDMTDFLDAHPGGAARIEMCQGQDLANFWSLYTLHLEREHILELLEHYRIGNLSSVDTKAQEALGRPLASMYANDPKRPRHKEGKLRVPSTIPWNSEPKDLTTLTDTFYTPNDLFFTRNHNFVPDVCFAPLLPPPAPSSHCPSPTPPTNADRRGRVLAGD